MKINKIFILSLLLISMLSVFVVGSSNERIALQEWKGLSQLDSYNLRSVHYNGIDTTDDISACAVGYGSSMGVYPINQRIGEIKYNYLVVPTESAIRIINSACGEINTIALSGVTFSGTMATIHASEEEYEQYVMMGFNSTSSEYGFYTFSFSTLTNQIEFNKYKKIDDIIDLDIFQGVACGYKQKGINDLGMCAIAQNKKIIIWDLETDNIINVTTTYTIQRISPETLPYGSVIDFDNDGNNEFFFSGWQWGGYMIYLNYVTYDLYSETLEEDQSISTTSWDTYITIKAGNSLNNFIAFDNLNENVIPITPCQIGGVSSVFEVCISMAYLNGHSHDSHQNIIIENDGTLHYEQWSGTNHFISMSTGIYSDFTVNKEYIWYDDANLTHLNVFIMDSDYETEKYKFNISVGELDSGFNEYTESLLMDIYSDDTKELILSNGQIYDILSGNKLSYHLPYLSNSSNGLLTGGDLNGDYVNEIIYSDANNIYIYSTNPTSDYITDLSVTTYYAYDLDGGIVYTDSDYTYNGSTVYGVNTNQTVAYDTCSSINLDVVQEYYLDGNDVKVLNYDCTTGGYFSCLAGMCLSETLYNFTDEGIQNGTIDFISGGWIDNGTTAIPISEDEEINFVMDSLNDNLKLIFALFMIAGIVILTAKQTKSPMVLVFVGIITTVLMSYLGMIPSVVLIILLITLVVLMLLGFALGMGRGSNE